jgi:hypothetical protein
LNPVDVPSPSALHVNLGFQREITQDFVVSADFAYRRFTHVGIAQPDLNHFNSARGPVIPMCLTDAERNDAQALCSTGAIIVQTNAGRATYKGLLVRADKRFSRGFQLLGSWAYSSNTGTNSGNGFNLDDFLSNHGPLDRDITHIVNLAAVVQLPLRFELGFNFSYASAPPFSAFVGGSDFRSINARRGPRSSSLRCGKTSSPSSCSTAHSSARGRLMRWTGRSTRLTSTK